MFTTVVVVAAHRVIAHQDVSSVARRVSLHLRRRFGPSPCCASTFCGIGRSSGCAHASYASLHHVHRWLACCPRAACAGSRRVVIACHLQLQLLLSFHVSVRLLLSVAQAFAIVVLVAVVFVVASVIEAIAVSCPRSCNRCYSCSCCH